MIIIINKQTNKGKKSFFQVAVTFTYIQNVMRIVGTVLYPAIPFINVTEIRTLRSTSLNAHILGALLL